MEVSASCLRTEVEKKEQQDDDHADELRECQPIAEIIAQLELQHRRWRRDKYSKLINKAREKAA